MEELHKLWRHHALHSKELHQWNENHIEQTCSNITKFETGQPVMVKNNVHHTFKPKYLLGFKVLKICNDRTVLLMRPNSKERKTNINYVKHCGTTDIFKNALDSSLSSIKTK